MRQLQPLTEHRDNSIEAMTDCLDPCKSPALFRHQPNL